MSMSMSVTVTGKTSENWDKPGTNILTARDGTELDIPAEVERVVSIVPPGTFLRITIETVDS